MTMIVLAVVTNALRLWGAIAGIMCIADVFSHQPLRFTHKSVTFLLSVALILAGISMPFVNVVPGFYSESYWFNGIMLASWLSAATAGWLKVCIDRNPLMWIVSVCCLLLCLLAAGMVSR